MSLEPSSLSFVDYSQALERLQRRTALRRAIMAMTGGGAFEAGGGEDQARRDLEVLDVWEQLHGPSLLGY